ncbi:MAG: Crp/Fnr family transcriptional regulator [Bacteroidetes bacterium]|nr:Crp/Fnr family transcriptional regulator [Bacteroidota bacterium]
MKQSHSLHDVPIFGKLSPSELKLVTDISKTKRYKKNQIIFLEGETFQGFYIVLAGQVKVYRLDGDGKEILLNRVDPFSSFAESVLFSKSHFHNSCAQAVEDSTVLFVPREEFAALMSQNLAFAIRISEALGVQLAKLDRKIGMLASSVDERVAKYLLNEVQLNNSIRLPEPFFSLSIHKKDLATHLGIASETFSRTLKKLKEERVIREVSKNMFVTNLKKLRKLAED